MNLDSKFHELNTVLTRHFYHPDLQALRIVLGTIEAHYLKIGDPAWLFYVAPPGLAKPQWRSSVLPNCRGDPSR